MSLRGRGAGGEQHEVSNTVPFTTSLRHKGGGQPCPSRVYVAATDETYETHNAPRRSVEGGVW